MTGKPVRFGLVGFGAWGQLHAQSIDQNKDAELVAIAVHSEASAEAARQKYPRAILYRDYRQLCRQEDIEIVDVVTPSDTHRSIAMAAIEAGKHLLLEKPMAITIEDAQAIVQAAEQRGIRLAVGHELRLSTQWGLIKSIIDQGTIGQPRYVLVELSRKPYRLGSSGWRYDASRVGNWVLEEPIHFFDLARWYLAGSGECVEVVAEGNSIDLKRPQLLDNFSAIMRFADGAYAVVSQTLGAFEHHQTVKVTGTKGAIMAGWSGAMDRTLEPTHYLKVFDGTEVRAIEPAYQSGEVFELRTEIQRSVEMVRDGRAPVASGVDGRWSVKLCLLAEQSIRERRSIPVSNANAT
ncbi:MAG: Gfo/Idh/MocA family protein [Planctomycetota bacterium]